MQTVPCWLCGKLLDLRITKGGKYYVVCDPCGQQCFIRREQGMERLKKLIKLPTQRNFQFEQHTELLFAIQGILREAEGLKREIEKLEDRAGFLFPDEELLRARDALQKRLNLLLAQLEQIAEKENSYSGLSRMNGEFHFEPLISTEEASSLLGIHPKTLQQMARAGRVPAIRIGKFWRFRKSDLDTWVRAGVNCARYAYRPYREEQR